MKNLKYQRGLTMWGMIFVLGVLGFTLFVTFKLIPPYTNDLKVKKALESMAKENPGSREAILTALDKRFQIDDTRNVNLRKDLTFEARGNQTAVVIAYDVVIPLMGNISLLIDFRHSVNVSAGGG